MSRYIDADKLTVYFEALAKQAEIEGLYNMAHIHNRCLQIIEDTPSSDVVEVRHGEWLKEGCCFYCSECKKTYGFGSTQTIYDVKKHWLHCPNCGAKMDGERSEEENKSEQLY